MAKPLTTTEEDAARLLQRAGLGRSAARCLALLMRGATVTSEEARLATGLSGPEVSEGMRELAARGGVIVEKVAREGPGRPSLRYRAGDAQGMRSFFAKRREALDEERRALDEAERRLSGA